MSSSKKEGLPIAVVIIPTYNEAANIGTLLNAIRTDIAPHIKTWQLKTLVVDGDSTDDTASIVAAAAAAHPGDISLYREPARSGIGGAYMKGFSIACKELAADAVIEFDGDFQHPPRMIPELLHKLDEGYDCVIGSRKLPGGGEYQDRASFRHFLTSGGARLARLILFFPGPHFKNISDPTTGLRATRARKFIDRPSMNIDRLHSAHFGYKFQVLYETLALGARYTEIPFTFQKRLAGRSKFNARTIHETLMACIKTRWHGLR